MAKTNFTKVEDAFDDEMRKQMRDELLKEADRVSGNQPKETPQVVEQKKVAAERKVMIQALQHSLKEMDNGVFDTHIGITKERLENLLKKGIDLTEKDLEILKKTKKKIDQYKKNHKDYNENLVEQERKKHINKRFNVRDKWLPLK